MPAPSTATAQLWSVEKPPKTLDQRWKGVTDCAKAGEAVIKAVNSAIARR